MSPYPNWSRWMTAIFATVVLSFLASSIFTHWRLIAIDRASLLISENAAPSIERLAAARGAMRQLQLLLREYVDASAAGATADPEPNRESQRAMNLAIADYLALPIFPGEQALWRDIVRDKDALNDRVSRCRAEVEHDHPLAAEEILGKEIAPAADALGSALTVDVEFNASHSHDLALAIVRTRGQCMVLALVLDAVCALIAVGGALALRRAIRAHWELADRHRRLLEERASELEQFSGRIAHDILSPLGAVAFALQIAGRGADEAARARGVQRGLSALQRVKRLVAGLLDFARAGARPSAGARTELGALEDLWAELRLAAADAGAELEVEVGAVRAVACNAGVLTSIVSNLARNAIKYIGHGARRAIRIRFVEGRDRVRCEVQDTGPGLPPGLEEHVFEPYVRGAHVSEAGIGLGLATVKRLVEAHAGQVGVHSVPGQGCTFWFELPAATEEGTTPHSANMAPGRPAHAVKG